MAAYDRTIITETELAFFEGANVAAGGKTSDAHNAWVGQAEAFLSNLTKYDIVGNWSSINIVYRLMFTEYAGHYGAMMAIRYDLNSFTTRIEGEDMINIAIFRMNEIINTLKDASIQDFMGV